MPISTMRNLLSPKGPGSARAALAKPARCRKLLGRFMRHCVGRGGMAVLCLDVARAEMSRDVMTRNWPRSGARKLSPQRLAGRIAGNTFDDPDLSGPPHTEQLSAMIQQMRGITILGLL